MKGVGMVMVLVCSLWPLASVDAGDARSAAIRQVREMAMRPASSAPAPAPPREEWVSERRVLVPGLGVFAVVPGHWERRISPTASSVPSLTIFREADRAPLTVPGGERLPADLRSGP
jgi:hypothetical protein